MYIFRNRDFEIGAACLTGNLCERAGGWGRRLGELADMDVCAVVSRHLKASATITEELSRQLERFPQRNVTSMND